MSRQKWKRQTRMKMKVLRPPLEVQHGYADGQEEGSNFTTPASTKPYLLLTCRRFLRQFSDPAKCMNARMQLGRLAIGALANMREKRPVNPPPNFKDGGTVRISPQNLTFRGDSLCDRNSHVSHGSQSPYVRPIAQEIHSKCRLDRP